MVTLGSTTEMEMVEELYDCQYVATRPPYLLAQGLHLPSPSCEFRCGFYAVGGYLSLLAYCIYCVLSNKSGCMYQHQVSSRAWLPEHSTRQGG